MRARRDLQNIIDSGEAAFDAGSVKLLDDSVFIEHYRIVARLGVTDDAVFMKAKRMSDDRTRMLVLYSNLTEAQIAMIKMKTYLFSTFENDQTIKYSEIMIKDKTLTVSMDLVEGGAPLSKIIEDASRKERHIELDENHCKYILYALVRALYLLNKDRQLLGHIDPTTIYCFDNGMIKIAGQCINYTDDVSTLDGPSS